MSCWWAFHTVSYMTTTRHLQHNTKWISLHGKGRKQTETPDVLQQKPKGWTQLNSRLSCESTVTVLFVLIQYVACIFCYFPYTTALVHCKSISWLCPHVYAIHPVGYYLYIFLRKGAETKLIKVMQVKTMRWREDPCFFKNKILVNLPYTMYIIVISMNLPECWVKDLFIPKDKTQKIKLKLALLMVLGRIVSLKHRICT